MFQSADRNDTSGTTPESEVGQGVNSGTRKIIGGTAVVVVLAGAFFLKPCSSETPEIDAMPNPWEDHPPVMPVVPPIAPIDTGDARSPVALEKEEFVIPVAQTQVAVLIDLTPLDCTRFKIRLERKEGSNDTSLIAVPQKDWEEVKAEQEIHSDYITAYVPDGIRYTRAAIRSEIKTGMTNIKGSAITFKIPLPLIRDNNLLHRQFPEGTTETDLPGGTALELAKVSDEQAETPFILRVKLNEANKKWLKDLTEETGNLLKELDRTFGNGGEPGYENPDTALSYFVLETLIDGRQDAAGNSNNPTQKMQYDVLRTLKNAYALNSGEREEFEKAIRAGDFAAATKVLDEYSGYREDIMSMDVFRAVYEYGKKSREAGVEHVRAVSWLDHDWFKRRLSRDPLNANHPILTEPPYDPKQHELLQSFINDEILDKLSYLGQNQLRKLLRLAIPVKDAEFPIVASATLQSLNPPISQRTLADMANHADELFGGNGKEGWLDTDRFFKALFWIETLDKFESESKVNRTLMLSDRADSLVQTDKDGSSCMVLSISTGAEHYQATQDLLENLHVFCLAMELNHRFLWGTSFDERTGKELTLAERVSRLDNDRWIWAGFPAMPTASSLLGSLSGAKPPTIDLLSTVMGLTIEDRKYELGETKEIAGIQVCSIEEISLQNDGPLVEHLLQGSKEPRTSGK